MAVAPSSLDWCEMASPKLPLEEVAAQFHVSPRTMWTWVRQFHLTKYQQPGMGKLTHLDPDEVRRKVKAVPKASKTDG